MWHEIGRIDGDPVVESPEVLGNRAPSPVEPSRIVVPTRKLRTETREGQIVHGGVAQPVLAQDLGRDSLEQARRVLGSDQELQVGMRMHVDEARADDATAGRDRLLPLCRAGFSERDDAATVDDHIRREQRGAGPVGDHAAGDHEIRHLPSPPSRISSGS